MTDREQERLTKMALGIARGIWCDRKTDCEPHFNCDICEFGINGGCLLKKFLGSEHYKEEHPQGYLTER